jgi:hypothetical protein
MIFYYTKLHFSKWNRFMGCLRKIKYEYLHSTFLQVRVLWFSQKWFLQNVVHPIKIYQHTNLQDPTLNGASSASAISERLKLWD